MLFASFTTAKLGKLGKPGGSSGFVPPHRRRETLQRPRPTAFVASMLTNRASDDLWEPANWNQVSFWDQSKWKYVCFILLPFQLFWWGQLEMNRTAWKFLVLYKMGMSQMEVPFFHLKVTSLEPKKVTSIWDISNEDLPWTICKSHRAIAARHSRGEAWIPIDSGWSAIE